MSYSLIFMFNNKHYGSYTIHLILANVQVHFFFIDIYSLPLG